jgi:hypothetical protein
MKKPKPATLRTVTNFMEVAVSLATFNRQAAAHRDRARSILRQTTYCVSHPASGTFGPGKFVGYADMDFRDYDQAHLGNSVEARFDGHVSKAAIESALSARFRQAPKLRESVRRWGTRLLGPDAFGNANPLKWRFVVLDCAPPRRTAGSRGGRRRSRGPGAGSGERPGLLA